tara:strand:+ start:1156 stop:1479 length:324 start_codon:yes stop_codon:yes gene_type:complete
MVGAVVVAAIGPLGCSVRARTMLVPAVKVRAVAGRHRALARQRWAARFQVTAVFRPRAEPMPPDPAPLDLAPRDLPRRLDCTSRTLCRWELDSRRLVEDALASGEDR